MLLEVKYGIIVYGAGSTARTTKHAETSTALVHIRVLLRHETCQMLINAGNKCKARYRSDQKVIMISKINISSNCHV